jgi:hypothetical protein
MRRFSSGTWFLAGLLAILLLLMATLRVLRWLRPDGGGVISNEIRDMVANFQGSLEALPAIPGKLGVSFSSPAAGLGLLALVAAGVVWAVRLRHGRGQQRSRSNPS